MQFLNKLPFQMAQKPPFIAFAKNPNLDQETAYTICRMVDSVGWSLVEKWDWNWLDKAGEDYRSSIDPALIEGAWKLLFEKEWYSLQTTNGLSKRISTIAPLKGLNNLRTLVLQDNVIEDLSPLSGMLQLKDLNCFENKVSDLTPIQCLKSIERLVLGKNPLASFKVLEQFANLRELTISNDQISRLEECSRLTNLQILRIEGEDSFSDFEKFPEMPALKLLRADGAQNLRGLEKFSSLENLSLFSGHFTNVAALQSLKKLTHLDLFTAKKLNIAALGGLFALRRLAVANQEAVEGLHVLSALPALHMVKISREEKCNAKELKALRALELTGWNVEFKADSRRFISSMDLEIVSQEIFKKYGSKTGRFMKPEDTNIGMLNSEKDWLVNEIRSSLSTRFEENKDFHLPYTSGEERVERVIIYSIEAYEAFRDIILNIQRVLCEAKNDWIIWCQSLLKESPEEQDVPDDAEDYIVWICPNKLVVAEDNAETIKKLVSWTD